MAESAVVGILRAMLTADTAQFDAGMRKAASTSKTTEKAISGLGSQVSKLTPQAERMVKAFQGDKLLYQANNLTQAVAKIGGAAKLTDADMKRVNGTLNEAIAKYKALGQAAPKALLDTERATRGATGPTQFFSAKLAALSVTAGLMVAQLAGRAVRALIDFGKEAFRSAGEIVDLSSKTGLGTKTIQEMKFVADQTGTSLDAMADASFKLGVRIAGGGTSVEAAAKKLGFTLQQLQAMRPDQLWDAVTAALGKVESATERNRLGMILIGRSYASVAGAMAEGYRNIANQATIATDAQLRELERLGDEWTKFRKNLVTGFAAAMGEVVLRNRVAADLMREQLQSGTHRTQSDFDAEVQRRILLNLVDAKTKDVTLTVEQGVAQQSYVQQLAAVRAEMARLTAAQRAEIDAALQLGVNTDELEDKFGLAEGTLRLYTAQIKSASSASKALAKSQEELAKEVDQANAAYRSFLNFVGEREIEDVGKSNDARNADIMADVNAQLRAIESTVDAAFDAADQKERIDAEWREHQNFIGERMMQDERVRMEAMKAYRERYLVQFTQSLQRIGEAATSGLFSMFFGGDDGGRAKQAKEEYESLKRSGTASAEAITRAFRAMKDEQTDFFDRFKGWTSGILREFKRMIDELLGMWIREFLGGMVRAIMRSRVGQALTNWLTGFIPGAGAGSGGGGGFIESAAKWGVGKLLGSGTPSAAVAYSSGAGGTLAATSIPGLYSGPAAITSQGASAGVSGGTSAGVSGWAAQALPPVAIGTALYLIFDALNNVDKPFGAGRFGLTSKPGRSFSMGGFVPPNVTMPAILHGGRYGEDIVPRQSVAEAQRGSGRTTLVQNITINGSIADKAVWKEAWRAHILPMQRQALFFNTDNLASDTKRFTRD